MEAPAGVLERLHNIRSTFELRHNPRARVVGERSFDVNGQPRKVDYAPRWELWDTDAEGQVYRVMTLETEEGEYILPGDWLVDFLNLVNPARYGGSVEKMVQAMVDAPNARVEQLARKEYDALVEHLADFFTPRKSRIVVPEMVL